MVRKYTLIVTTFLCLSMALLLTVELIAKETVLDEYLEIKERPVSLIFLRTDECLGCNKTVMRCFNLLNSDIDCDVYAVVNARRQIELKKFSRLFRWKKATMLLKEEMQKKFDIKKNCLVVVFDKNGNKLGEVGRFEEDAFSKLLKIYKGDEE